jgi:hypothetical protein
MFKCEPSRYMTKPRYLIAMRRVYGFQIAATEEASDRATAFLLERCYNAFDYNNRYVCVCVCFFLINNIYHECYRIEQHTKFISFFHEKHTSYYILHFFLYYYHYYYLLSLLLSIIIIITIYHYYNLLLFIISIN